VNIYMICTFWTRSLSGWKGLNKFKPRDSLNSPLIYILFSMFFSLFYTALIHFWDEIFYSKIILNHIFFIFVKRNLFMLYTYKFVYSADWACIKYWRKLCVNNQGKLYSRLLGTLYSIRWIRSRSQSNNNTINQLKTKKTVFRMQL